MAGRRDARPWRNSNQKTHSRASSHVATAPPPQINLPADTPHPSRPTLPSASQARLQETPVILPLMGWRWRTRTELPPVRKIILEFPRVRKFFHWALCAFARPPPIFKVGGSDHTAN